MCTLMSSKVFTPSLEGCDSTSCIQAGRELEREGKYLSDKSPSSWVQDLGPRVSNETSGLRRFRTAGYLPVDPKHGHGNCAGTVNRKNRINGKN